MSRTLGCTLRAETNPPRGKIKDIKMKNKMANKMTKTIATIVSTLAAITLFSQVSQAEIISNETVALEGSASRVVYALSSCPAQLAELMKGANYVGQVKATRVHESHDNGSYETITETIKVESGTGGVFRPAKKVAELTMTAKIHDTRLACDSINCHSYTCELTRSSDQ